MSQNINILGGLKDDEIEYIYAFIAARWETLTEDEIYKYFVKAVTLIKAISDYTFNFPDADKRIVDRIVDEINIKLKQRQHENG